MDCLPTHLGCKDGEWNVLGHALLKGMDDFHGNHDSVGVYCLVSAIHLGQVVTTMLRGMSGSQTTLICHHTW